MPSWQDLLQTRRRCLLAAAEKYGSLGCALIHVGPAELARLDSLPAMYGRLLDVQDYQTPAGGKRRILLRQRDDWPEFRLLAEEAGRILADAPLGSLPIPDSILANRNNFCRWVEAVFHVMGGRRLLWADGMTFGRNARHLRQLADMFKGREYLSAWADALPDFWLAELPCIYRASVDVIDRLTAAAVAPPAPQAVEVPKPLPDPRHSPDFRSVVWHGEAYTFTKTQALCVKALWEALDSGTPERDGGAIIDDPATKGQIPQARFVDVFKSKGKMHPAWGTMIVGGETKGAYRLADAPAPKPSPKRRKKSARGQSRKTPRKTPR